MKTATYLRLARLHARHGPREFGKIVQKLVALAFRHGGCMHVVERGVQGVDVDVAWSDEKYSVEIKTTRTSHVVYQTKDLVGLQRRGQDGYRPLVGVLRLGALSDWYLVDANRMRPGSHDIECLRPYCRHDLGAHLRLHFELMVEQHFDGALLASQSYLDGVLREG